MKTQASAAKWSHCDFLFNFQSIYKGLPFPASVNELSFSVFYFLPKDSWMSMQEDVSIMTPAMVTKPNWSRRPVANELKKWAHGCVITVFSSISSPFVTVLCGIFNQLKWHQMQQGSDILTWIGKPYVQISHGFPFPTGRGQCICEEKRWWPGNPALRLYTRAYGLGWHYLGMRGFFPKKGEESKRNEDVMEIDWDVIFFHQLF